jgi:hypothetical protein
MSVRQRGRIERGLGPASAGSFHGEFPDVGDASTLRRVGSVGFALISGRIDPRPFGRIVVGPTIGGSSTG